MAEGKQVSGVAKSVEDFSLDFHKCLAGKAEGNFVSSALSAHTVLAMAAYGAEGSTGQAMRKALHLPEDDSQAHQEFQTFVDSINDVPNVVLKLANKIYAACESKEQFKSITSKYFRSECELVNFAESDKTAGLINEWCLAKTAGKIKDVIQPADLNALVRMVLLNAVYFKGNWKNQFDAKLTKPKAFHVNSTTTIEVPTMYIEKKFFYDELEAVDAKVVALPYENEDMYMVLIVPNEIDGLAKVEQNLEKIDLKSEYFKYRNNEVHLSLPKFKIESTHDLKAPLTELGMAEIFSDSANFRGILDEPIFVSKVVQKAFIEVNEEGCEAAAVTGIQVMLMCMPPPPVELSIDRPFLFKIMHKSTTLFSGHIVNPVN